MIGLSFPSAALFLVPAGTRPLYQRNPRWLASVPVILFAAHLLFAARYDIVDQYTFFIPTYVAMSLLLAPGVDRLLQARGVWRQLRWPLIVTLFWSPLAYAVLPSVVPWIAARVALPIPTRRVPNRDPLRWFLQPWHTGYDGPERFVREALPTLPDDAVLLIDLTQAGPLYYGQCVFGLNPGVQINHWRCLGAPQPIDATNVARWVAEGRLFTGSADQSCMAQAEDVWVLEAYALERAGYFYRVVNKANDSERAPGGPR
jgi:hypothetical protein